MWTQKRESPLYIVIDKRDSFFCLQKKKKISFTFVVITSLNLNNYLL